MTERVRQRVARATVVALVILAPARLATAQPDVFFQRLADLTAALEGTYGDEGPRIEQALDQMSRALAEWDRSIHASETRLATESSNQSTIDALVSLARMYAQRGRTDDAQRQIERALRLDPKRADAYLLRGLLLDAAGKPVEAAGAFAKTWALNASDPINAYYLLRHATTIGENADVRAARASLTATYRRLLAERTRRKTLPFPDIGLVERSAAGAPLVPLAAYAGVYARIARGEYDEAIGEFRNAAAVDPMVTRDASEAYRIRGLTHWAAFEDDKSIEQLANAIRSNPRDERSRLALFHVLRLGGRDAEALVTLEDAIRVLPESPRARWWLGVTYERMNRFVDARQEFERAAQGAVAGRSAVYAAIGRLAAREADLPAAADAFARSIDANPNDAAAHKYLAGVFLQLDRTADALVEWDAAVMIDPLDAEAHAGVGQLLLNMDRNDDAIGALQRAVELLPDHTEARYALAIALTRVGNTRQADQEFARVEREQRQALAQRRLTMSLDVLKEEASLRAAEGDYERAAALWRQVIDREPAGDPVAYRELASAYTKLGRNEDATRARAMYQKAVQSFDRGAR